MQLAYNINMGVANPGMIADAAFDMIESFQAFEVLDIGLGIIKRAGYDLVGRLPKANKSTLVFSGDLVTSNVINMSVNGVAMSPVTFASTHLNTMNLIIAALEAITAQVSDAYLDAADTNNRTLIIKSVDGLDCIVTGAVVTGGAGQATIVVTTGTFDTLEGIAVSTMAKEETLGTLLVQFKVGEAIPVMRKGKIYVVPETNVASGDPLYCRFLGDGATKFAGHFRNDSDSSTAFIVSYAMFKTTALAGSPAIVEINLP